MEILTNRKEILTSTQSEILIRLFKFEVNRINWDYDQTMVDSETPVKQRFFEVTGLDYRDRKIDSYTALSYWAEKDGHMPFNEAVQIEVPIWRDAEVLSNAIPILAMQSYSKEAHEHGIIQTITTAREPRLKEVTLDSVRKNFPWIDITNVNIRSGPRTPSEPFKGVLTDLSEAVVCFEDSVASTEQILRLSKAYVILFPRLLERGRFLGNERVIEFLNMDEWSELLNAYKNSSVAQSY